MKLPPKDLRLVLAMLVLLSLCVGRIVWAAARSYNTTGTPLNKILLDSKVQKMLEAGAATNQTPQSLSVIPNPPRKLTRILSWKRSFTGDVTWTEVWSSTNLTLWTLRTNLPASFTNCTIELIYGKEFFKIRGRDNLGNVTDWARK